MPTWTTRAETDADIPAIRDIILRAFPTATEADLVDALRADPAAWIDGLSVLAATAGGRPVGHALLTPRFGFRRASGFGIRASFDVPDEALMALPLDDSPAVPGGVIRYPAVFGV
ncbi:GNAT family N-acetyltransferase [Dietzia maris]|uniref:GNAT family N-acetyltransferase n=1 Tax=Dietzia maris TaxID=37915 RepID=UPI00223AA956|nr:hypothetical protein [Dietzia maris]MCT1522493.1 hypothetical protein [Dietzia maris]